MKIAAAHRIVGLPRFFRRACQRTPRRTGTGIAGGTQKQTTKKADAVPAFLSTSTREPEARFFPRPSTNLHPAFSRRRTGVPHPSPPIGVDTLPRNESVFAAKNPEAVSPGVALSGRRLLFRFPLSLLERERGTRFIYNNEDVDPSCCRVAMLCASCRELPREFRKKDRPYRPIPPNWNISRNVHCERRRIRNAPTDTERNETSVSRRLRFP